jgi:hypothetical protein
MNGISVNIKKTLFWILVAANFAVMSAEACAQAPPVLDDVSRSSAAGSPVPFPPAYVPPSPMARFNNYANAAVGPYAILGSALSAGIDQQSNTPPEWRQGATGYGKRFGSSFGISAVGATTRYALSSAVGEDTAYYRCDCSGFLPRLRHAVISSITARRGADGHRVFSVSAAMAPYAGSMTAVYGWYPDRYGYKDGLRIGSYDLLGSMAGNIAREFLTRRVHSLFHHGRTGNERRLAGSTVQPSTVGN